ncbi:MAG: DNA translocase FtsK [Myxococcales bacterium]|nr:DNA translocase FtsK [Myxococcales bacterium]
MAKARNDKNKKTPESHSRTVETPTDIPSRSHEVLGVAVSALALVILLSLVSYDGLDPTGDPIPGGNLIGTAGLYTAWLLFTLLGAGAYLLDLLLWGLAIALFIGRVDGFPTRIFIGGTVLTLLSAVEIHTILRDTTIAGGHLPGGIAGGFLGDASISLLSVAGTHIAALAGIVITVLVVTELSLFLIGRTVGLQLFRALRSLWAAAARIVKLWMSEMPDDEPASDDGAIDEVAPSRPTPRSVTDNSDAEDALDDNATPPAPPKIVTQNPPSRRAPKNDDELDITPTPKGEFVLPSPALLSEPDEKKSAIDEAYLQSTAQRLAKVLSEFHVWGEVKEIHPGPVVTMFEFQPKAGTKLSKIESLSNEIAMALEVKRVRVVAPIPGKNAVGFELPNKTREMVHFREIVEDDSFSKSRGKLPMALGKDISGMPFTVDLAKMPHLLMAGTTGSGKSVTMNTMILSFLYKHTPDQFRLLLIDPKMIEFQPYNHIPHLLLPVVTDMSQACLALKWAVDEMERRYQLFADIGAKNLESYNARVEKQRKDEEERQSKPLAPAETAIAPGGAVVEFGPLWAEPKKIPDPLPLIVICIDELADLMMVGAKDVETHIARLAQKARAAGLHLIVATQRPSTDVVTGLIKANFPARLSCLVSSHIDSRTILNASGAENLLGNGDMLVLPPGTSDLMRVQGAFVSEEEVADVVDFLKKQGLPQYNDDILKAAEDDEGTGDLDADKDEYYDQAVALVAQAQACSISMIQRRLKIGYNRAANIVEIMEREGVVGPATGGVAKREVLIGPL